MPSSKGSASASMKMKYLIFFVFTRSCPHCGKVLSDSNEICNHTVVRPATDTDSISRSSVSTSVIQSNPIMFNTTKPTKWLYSEDNGFKCDICGKPFRKKEHLFQHRKLHSGGC